MKNGHKHSLSYIERNDFRLKIRATKKLINMRYNLEYHLAVSHPASPVDLDRIEDLHTDYLFGGKSFGKDHVKAGELLRRHLDLDRPQRP